MRIICLFSSDHGIPINMKKFHEKFPERSNWWKGGYSSKNIPLYDTFVCQLEPIEQCRRNELDSNILEVKCTYCGKWYMPKAKDAAHRIGGINSNDTHKFYCSDECKQECPTFWKQKHWANDKKIAKSTEVAAQLRQLVFERDNWACQRCGTTCSLHCHHIDPVKRQPMFANDIDSCVTFCADCHKWSHMEIDDCRYAELRRCA
jgi:hypothetical protein